MAGTLVIDTLKASSGVLATQNGMTGIAKAWVNFNGVPATPTIRSSMNVSSVTKTGTGGYTINFTTAMPDLNYSTIGSSWYSGVTASLFAILGAPASTSSKAISTQNAGSSASVDVDQCCVAFYSA